MQKNSLTKIFSIEDIVLTNDEMLVIKAGQTPIKLLCGNGCGSNCGSNCGAGCGNTCGTLCIGG